MRFNKKKFLSVVSVAILLGIFLPLFPARADLWSSITGFLGDAVGKPIFEGIAWFVQNTLGVIASLALNLTQGLLGWVISPSFINVSMTGPDNVFVTESWGIVRDLANIILVLALVIIALGIILGIEEYQAKKTLPVLIIIAMLINFTPVICGLVIDFSNILMNYFLKGGVSTGFSDAVMNGLSSIRETDPIRAIGVTLVYFVFGLVGAFVFSLYALLFAARIVFLWILVIFSPIAFVSRVFPQSGYVKKFFPSFFYWSGWWDSFIQWCVVGIYGGFFIFLANKLMLGFASIKYNSAPTGAVSAFSDVFGYLLPILLLLIGFFSAIEAGTAGLAVIPGMEKAGRKMLAGAGVAALTPGAAKGAIKGIGEGIQAGREAGKGTIGQIMSGLRGGYEGVATGAEQQRSWMRKTAEKIPIVGKPGTYAKERKEALGEAEKRAKGLSNKELDYWSTRVTTTEAEKTFRAACMNELTDRGKITASNTIYSKEAQIFGFDAGAAAKKLPSLAQRFGKNTNEVVRAMGRETFTKTVLPEGLTAETLAAMNVQQLQYLAEKGSQQQVNALKKYVTSPTGALHPDLHKIHTDLLAKASAPGATTQDIENYNNFHKVTTELDTNPNFK